MTWLGAEGDILHPNEYSCRRIKLYTPVLTSGQFNGLRTIVHNAFKSKTIHTLFTDDLKRGLDAMFEEAEKAIREGVSLLILSDRDMTEQKVPIPPLLALSALHQHLVRQGLRTKVSLIVESGEVREVHHFAALIGYGADAIHPYLVYETYKQLIAEEAISFSFDEAVTKFGKSVTEGVVKVMSKVGISTVQSYRGAQIFEAVGISEDVIQAYFTGTASQLGGIDLETIAHEAKLRHEAGYQAPTDQTLESGSDFQWRKMVSTMPLIQKRFIRFSGHAAMKITIYLSNIQRQRTKKESASFEIYLLSSQNKNQFVWKTLNLLNPSCADSRQAPCHLDL